LVLSALDARLRGIDVDGVPRQVRVFSSRLREEQGCVLTGGDTITTSEEREDGDKMDALNNIHTH
jgi:hypothetical protein